MDQCNSLKLKSSPFGQSLTLFPPSPIDAHRQPAQSPLRECSADDAGHEHVIGRDERRPGGYTLHVLPSSAGLIAIGVAVIGQETLSMEDLHGHGCSSSGLGIPSAHSLLPPPTCAVPLSSTTCHEHSINGTRSLEKTRQHVAKARPRQTCLFASHQFSSSSSERPLAPSSRCCRDGQSTCARGYQRACLIPRNILVQVLS